MNKWFDMLNEAREKRSSREPSPFKSAAQKRYKAQRRKNDICLESLFDVEPKGEA